ncbi:hypothetical protein J7354_01460 [Sulfitobacter sp. R18_2]|uniref:hypothetical protein n=1 Tax=Sulfitobacter sp. R18_2 TaxID=2821105 RepID=UPI001ADC9548|nr:hypothetical protein [Sulfitobacter sp. R18_2]MBO9437318.1 hypothetical protein [Sulfitobacter sp. R18_2]
MGFRGKYKNKRDSNEPELVAELRAYGLSVCLMDRPADALVGYGGNSYLVEFKTPKGPLSEPQKAFLETWKGDWTELRTTEEASQFAQMIRGQK